MRVPLCRTRPSVWRGEKVTAKISKNGKWRDLMPRLLSAVVMVAVGLGAVLSSHLAFTALVVVEEMVGKLSLFESLRCGRFKY